MFNKRLMRELTEAKPYIIKNIIFQWLKLVANIIIISSFGILLQDVFEGVFEKVVPFTILVFVLIVVRFICTIMANQASHHASSAIKVKLRDMLYGKLLRLGSSYHEKVSTAEVTQVSVEGIEQIENYVGKYLPQFFYSLLAPLTLFLVFSFVSMKAAIILLICVPLIPISIMAFMKIAKKILKNYWGVYANLGGTFLENLQGLTTLKIYEADEDRHQSMNKEAEEFRKITMKLLRMQLNSIVIMNFIAFGGAAIGLIIAATEYCRGNILFWQAFSIILLSAEFFIPMRLLGSFFHIAMNGTTAANKLYAMIDLEEDMVEIPENKKEKKLNDVVIELEDVTFSYEENVPVLNKISMEFGIGKFTSIVGKSGCGKSTIASLIMGGRTRYSGHLYVDGTENRLLDDDKRMSTITLVNHDSYIFKGTVRENLLMGNGKATENEMLNALDKVNLKDFILSEGGLDLNILEQGSNLSGGQRQRLAIARALLHDTEVYIFDEATSNIDVESEECILKVIHELGKTKTVILVSHRLANVVPSNKIYVLDGGKIVETGTHDTLIQTGKVYKEMYDGQYRLEQLGRGGVSNA
jgi:ABC-type transport system involved in cytochrome bd biosynthesis fused ATPase/permease subunit